MKPRSNTDMNLFPCSIKVRKSHFNDEKYFLETNQHLDYPTKLPIMSLCNMKRFGRINQISCASSAQISQCFNTSQPTRRMRRRITCPSFVRTGGKQPVFARAG